MKKFSIVIPTYNSEKYITELLNTLVNQEFPRNEFEVIAVDDCSTDNTVKVLEQYLNKINLKIYTLDKNSGGPGKPRNVALKHASGEYILFVDSDDYINSKTLKDASDFIKQYNSDILLIKMAGVNGRGVPQSMFKETLSEVTLLNSRIIYTLSPTKIFKTSLLRDNNIYFPEDLKSAEDQLFTMKAYINAKKISILSDKSYYYATKRDGEHMSSAYVSPHDFYKVMALIVEEILNSNLEEMQQKYILAEFINRHFTFSRTNGFSRKVKKEEQIQWINALGDFIKKIPESVDSLVLGKIKPLLYYARLKDLENYRKVEDSYHNGEYNDFYLEDNKLNVQFNENEPYFYGIEISKPKVKMTNFNFDNYQINIEMTISNFILNEKFYNTSLKLYSRNKKNTIYIPLKFKAGNQLKCEIPLESIKSFLIREKIWDVFLEIQINNKIMDIRIGNNRNKYKYSPETSALVEFEYNHYRITPFFTKNYDNISFYFTPINIKKSISANLKNKNIITLNGLERSFVFEEGMVTLLTQKKIIIGYLKQYKDNQINIRLNTNIKKNDLNKIEVFNINKSFYHIQ